jgi:hypothetical protein
MPAEAVAIRTPRSGGIETKDFGASGETEPDMMRPANEHFQAKWKPVRRPEMRQQTMPEHDAEKCQRLSDDTMLTFFDLDPDDFRPIRPKIIRI